MVLLDVEMAEKPSRSSVSVQYSVLAWLPTALPGPISSEGPNVGHAMVVGGRSHPRVADLLVKAGGMGRAERWVAPVAGLVGSVVTIVGLSMIDLVALSGTAATSSGRANAAVLARNADTLRLGTTIWASPRLVEGLLVDVGRPFRPHQGITLCAAWASWAI